MKGLTKVLGCDLDGTIIKNREAHFTSIKKTAKHFGIRVPTDEEIANAVEGTLRSLWRPAIPDSIPDKAIHSVYMRFYWNEKTRLAKGVNLLGDLQDNGLKLFLVTVRPFDEVTRELEKHKIEYLFPNDRIICCGHNEKSEALRDIQSKHGKTAYLGDQWSDIVASVNAGVIPIAIMGGLGNQKLIKKIIHKLHTKRIECYSIDSFGKLIMIPIIKPFFPSF